MYGKPEPSDKPPTSQAEVFGSIIELGGAALAADIPAMVVDHHPDGTITARSLHIPDELLQFTNGTNLDGIKRRVAELIQSNVRGTGFKNDAACRTALAVAWHAGNGSGRTTLQPAGEAVPVSAAPKPAARSPLDPASIAQLARDADEAVFGNLVASVEQFIAAKRGIINEDLPKHEDVVEEAKSGRQGFSLRGARIGTRNTVAAALAEVRLPGRTFLASRINSAFCAARSVRPGACGSIEEQQRARVSPVCHRV
jgi:hypothetical protein